MESSFKNNAKFKLFHHGHTAINVPVCMILLQCHHSSKLQRLRFALILASITPQCIRIHCTSTHTCTLLVHYTLSGKHITSQLRMDPSLCHSIRTANRPSYTADNKQLVYSCILINNAPIVCRRALNFQLWDRPSNRTTGNAWPCRKPTP